MPPNDSNLAAALQPGGIPPDVIVVRGYLGTSDVLERANAVLTRLGKGAALSQAAIDAAKASDDFPRRIYLSARLDRWVEIDDPVAQIAHLRTEDPAIGLQDVYTVWLRRYDQNDKRHLYRVVSLLPDEHAFVTGPLLEAFMGGGQQGQAAWDEQGYGSTTGKQSIVRCF